MRNCRRRRLRAGRRGAVSARRSAVLALALAIAWMAGVLVAAPRAVAQNVAPPEAVLTEAELAWLEAHPVIRVAPDPDFPPFEFFDERGDYVGIAAEYIELLGERLPVTFEIVRLENWTEVLDQARAREVDMFAAAAETTQRQEYMAFTDAHIRMPGAIITTTETSDQLTLRKLHGKRVVVVAGYAWHDLIALEHPEIELVIAPDIASALRMTSFGIVDAMMGDLATSTYPISREGLANLRVAGQPAHRLNLALAVRSDWPELVGILEKGLLAIAPAERTAIVDKWIQLRTPSLLQSKKFWAIVGGAVLTVAFVIAGILFWNRMLKTQVAQRTDELSRELAWRKEAETELRQHRDHLDVLVKERTAELSEANEKMKRDLDAAALVQQSLLPRAAPDVTGTNVAWQYRPCDELAGDILNVFQLDATHIGVYVADVSGHGVAASLLSVAVSRVMSPDVSSSSLLIRPGADGGPPQIVPPADVARELNDRFPMMEPANRYFTLLYGVIDVTARTFRFVSAGHPPVVTVVPGQAPCMLHTESLAIGWVPGTDFEEHSHSMVTGERLYLYSDGVPEAMDPEMNQFGDDRMIEFINESRMTPLDKSVGSLMVRVEEWCSTSGPLDDITILAVEMQ